MVARLRRWLGFDTTPVVGVQFRDEGAYLAVVRAPNRVVGLGMVAVPSGSVTGGRVDDPAVVANLIDEELSSIHWRRPPPLRIAIPPVSVGGSLQPGVVTAAVHAHGSHDAVEVGTVAVAESVLASILATAQLTAGRVEAIEPTPVSVSRLLRIAQPAQVLRFARSSEPGRRWTLCDAIGSFEVESSPYDGQDNGLTTGHDPTRMRPVEWGSIAAEPPVRAGFARPNLFAPAIGAALGAYHRDPSVDLLDPARRVVVAS